MVFQSINYGDVEADLKRQNEGGYFSQKQFNTTGSSCRGNFAPEYKPPSNRPYSFRRWISLILSSRSLSPFDIQTITIPNMNLRLLQRTATRARMTYITDEKFYEDVEYLINPLFEGLKFPPRGLTMHITSCSTTDGAQKHPGGVLHSVDEVVHQLLTSLRALSAFVSYIDKTEERLTYYGSPKLPELQQASFTVKNDGNEPFKIYFLPFDERMTPERRYRVFCPPAYKFAGWKPQITAISQ